MPQTRSCITPCSPLHTLSEEEPQLVLKQGLTRSAIQFSSYLLIAHWMRCIVLGAVGAEMNEPGFCSHLGHTCKPLTVYGRMENKMTAEERDQQPAAGRPHPGWDSRREAPGC